MLLMLPLGCRVKGFLHHADALITSCQDVHLQCLQAQYSGALAAGAATVGKSEVEYVVTGVLPRPAGGALVDDWDCLRVGIPICMSLGHSTPAGIAASRSATSESEMAAWKHAVELAVMQSCRAWSARGSRSAASWTSTACSTRARLPTCAMLAWPQPPCARR